MEFNSLPLDVHLEIFSYLSVSDVRKIRQVCKQWNGLINGKFKFKRLRCQEVEDYKTITYYFEFDFYFLSTRSFLDYASANPKFQSVKYLLADLYPIFAELEVAFDFLNSFTSLENVKFVCTIQYIPLLNPREVERKTLIVSLNRLVKANISFERESLTSKVGVVLDLPSLLYLAVDSLENVKVGHPEKLRTLAIGGLFRGDPNYSEFTSLIKICSVTDDVRSISTSFIKRLPSLREIHFDFYSFCLWLKIKDHHLLEPPPSFLKATPRIFYFGFEISLNQMYSEGEQLPAVLCSDEASTRFVSRNLDRSIDNNPLVWSIDYNRMANELDDTELLGVMPRKFPEIRHLQVSGTVAEPDRLLKFIGQFKVLYIDLEGASLPPSFFQKLAENGPFIRQLVIKSDPTMSILSGDFDFAFELKSLHEINLEDCPLSLNFVARLLSELKSIRKVGLAQPRDYGFSLSLWDYGPSICLFVNGSGLFSQKTSREEAPELINTWRSRLKTGGIVCPKELQILLRHLELERQTQLFMMRKCLYDHTHSICLSKEQVRLLNFPL